MGEEEKEDVREHRLSLPLSLSLSLSLSPYPPPLPLSFLAIMRSATLL
jgi:hypothetical protein